MDEQSPVVVETTAQEIPAEPAPTIPGVRIVLVGGQQIDVPLVSQVGETTNIDQAELTRRFSRPEYIEFPVTRLSVNPAHVILFTLIELRVMTPEEAAQAQAAAAMQQAIAAAPVDGGPSSLPAQ